MRDGEALLARYRRVAEAQKTGHFDEARGAFLEAIGLGSRAQSGPAEAPGAAPDGVQLVNYRRPRRVDLLALEHGARNVAKFEDLRLAEARRMQAWAAARGLRAVVAGPYSKRFDLAVAGETPAGELYAAIVSRGNEAESVAEAERDRSPDGTLRAGLALGYPRCCAEHFAALTRDGRAFEDGVNEAALRSTAGIRGEIPWEINTLCEVSPVGFTPCRVDCTEALAFARRLLAAVERADPAGFATVRATLRRPVLFFRHALFFVFDGEPVPGRPEVRYRRIVASDPGAAWRDSLGAWQWAEVGKPLESGDSVTLGDSLACGGARWPVVDAEVPMLFRFV